MQKLLIEFITFVKYFNMEGIKLPDFGEDDFAYIMEAIRMFKKKVADKVEDLTSKREFLEQVQNIFDALGGEEGGEPAHRREGGGGGNKGKEQK